MSCKNTSPDWCLPKLSEPFFGWCIQTWGPLPEESFDHPQGKSSLTPWLNRRREWKQWTKKRVEYNCYVNTWKPPVAFCPLSFLAPKKNLSKKEWICFTQTRLFVGEFQLHLPGTSYMCLFQRPWNLGGHSAKMGSPNQWILVLPSNMKYVTIH